MSVIGRRHDALDDEYNLLRKWMPRNCKSHAYNSYLDFMHFPQAVATSHAKARLKERKNVTGCVKGLYVPGTNHTVVATCVPCRAANATPVRCVQTHRDKKHKRRETRKLYAAAKESTKSAKCAAAYARLNSYMCAAADTCYVNDKEMKLKSQLCNEMKLKSKLLEAQRRRAAVSNLKKVRKWDKIIYELQTDLLALGTND